MKRAGLLLFILSIASAIAGNCQQKKLDSLLSLNNSYHKEDSLKAVYLRDIFRMYAHQSNYQQFKLYADSAIGIASSLPNKSPLATIYMRIGAAYHVSDRLKAISFYRKGIEIAQTANATKTEADCYLDLGDLYENIQYYSESLDANLHALELYASLGDKGDISSCLMNIAGIYKGINQRVKALEYAKKALAAFESDGGSIRGIGVACNLIGSIYLSASDNELAAAGLRPIDRFLLASDIFEKGLKAAVQTSDKGLVSELYTDFGMLNELHGNTETAMQFFQKALNESKEDETDQGAYVNNLITAGKFYLKRLKDTIAGSSLLYHGLALAKNIRMLAAQQDAYTVISGMHEGKRNFDSSLFYFRESIIIRDSILNEEREKEITRKQLKADFDIKEREFKQTQLITDAKLKQQVFLAMQQEQELQLKKQQLEISDKEKSLQRLLFLQKQAELEEEQKNKDNLLKQNQLKADFDKKIFDKQIDIRNIELTANKRWSFFLGLLACVVFAVAFFIYQSRRKTIRLSRIISEQKVELEELVKVKDKIFSLVSHDMRAPVNHLMAFSSLLQDGDIEQQKLISYVEQIKSTLDHTSSMMENLLNWSASQMEGFTPVLEMIDLVPILDSVIRGALPAALKKKISIENEAGESIRVFGDKNMIELILRNLLNNAIKFSHQEGKITITAFRNEKKFLGIGIKDEGVGLTDDKVKKINAATVQTVESTYGTGREKGTGIGLMLSKHFANLMNGKLVVESREGAGSVFSIILAQAAIN